MAAPTISSDPTTQDQYLTQLAVTASLWTSLRQLWATTNPLSGAVALARYREGVHAVTEQYAQAAISLAADYFQAARAQAGITSTPPQVVTLPPPRSLVDAGLDWAMRAQQEMDANVARIQGRIEAAAQKAVIDAGREQVIASVAGDEKALGFARVARPGACAFCLLQAVRRKKDGRVGVYKTRGTAGASANENFSGSGQAKFHNNCHCVIEPIFTADHELDPHLAAAERLYADSTVNAKRGESLNAFRRALVAQRAGKNPAPIVGLPVQAPNASGGNPLAGLLDRLVDLGARPSAA